MAAHLGIRLHEIEVRPQVTDLLPRMVDILDEPIGDPAAINTLLMCDAARAAGVKVLLSGMGADELFGGYRKHLACLLAARYRRLPTPLRARAVEPLVRSLPVAVRGQGLRTTRWAQRFVSFAALPEEAAFRRSYTLYEPDELARLVDPGLATDVDTLVAASPQGLRGQPAARPRQPHVPGGRAAVPPRPEPHVHRPRQHGGVHRGPRPVRRSVGFRRRVRDPRCGEDPRAGAEGGTEGRRAGVGAARDRGAAEVVVRRAAAGMGDERPRVRWSTTCSSGGPWCPAGSSSATRCCGSSTTSGRADATCPSRSGSCSRSSSGTGTCRRPGCSTT